MWGSETRRALRELSFAEEGAEVVCTGEREEGFR